MATKKAPTSLAKLRIKAAITKIKIKAGREKNTNAHKALKKQIAQELTKISINKLIK